MRPAHSSYRVLATCSLPPEATGGSGHRSPASSSSLPSSCTFSLLELLPHTGRKRQLRAHCHFDLGCSMVGERLVALGLEHAASQAAQRRLQEREQALARHVGWTTTAAPLPLMLHAHQLCLQHPELRQCCLLRVSAPPSAAFATVAQRLFGWTPRPAATRAAAPPLE